MTIARSWLYAPAISVDLIAAALQSTADAVVIDLESGIAADGKAGARDVARAALEVPSAKPRWVRINSATSAWGTDDLAVVAGAEGVRVPRCEAPDDVRRIADVAGIPVAVVIGTALGLELAFDLATSHPDVAGIMLDEAALRSDLRVTDPSALGWARGRIVAAARAAGLPSPVQSAWLDIQDLDGLESSSIEALEQGFFGRTVVHPAQLQVVNDVFTPNSGQIAAARESVGSSDPEVASLAVWLVQIGDSLGL